MTCGDLRLRRLPPESSNGEDYKRASGRFGVRAAGERGDCSPHPFGEAAGRVFRDVTARDPVMDTTPITEVTEPRGVENEPRF